MLDFSPKFQAYQRQDIDFVLMIANDKTGRLLRPQLNFFGGSDTVVYATAGVFNGIPDKVNNIDLDNTVFPVMPWVLTAQDDAIYAGQLNRLFALGNDAYNLAGAFHQMKHNPDLAINGSVGTFSIEPNGLVNIKPLWAKFVEGELETLLPYQLGSSQIHLPEPAEQEQQTDKVNGDYNDKTWDTQRSIRRQNQ